MKILQAFYSDFQTRDEVKGYLLATLKKQAGNMAFEGKDTSGIKEAKDCIEKAFRDLDNQFKVKKEKLHTSSK